MHIIQTARNIRKCISPLVQIHNLDTARLHIKNNLLVLSGENPVKGIAKLV